MKTFTLQILCSLLLLFSFGPIYAQVVNCGPYSSSPGTTFDDNNPVNDPITVTGTSPQLIDDLNVAVSISYPYIEDLQISLTSPSGTTVNLMFAECGGTAYIDLDIEFDDEGTAINCASPTTGVFIPPDGSLSDFDGETFDGTWTLTVADTYFLDDGTLVQWCLLPTLITIPCDITDISAGAQTCDANTSTYTQEVTVTTTDPIATGSLNVNGQLFAVVSSPQTVVLTGLAANGQLIDVTVFYTDQPFCEETATNLFSAPLADCTPLPSSTCGPYSSSPNLAIDDANDPSDDIIVSGTGPDLISDLNVVVVIDHTFMADLDISLTGPNGTIVDLMFDQCGTNENMNIEFDDEGVAIDCGTPTIGTFIPTDGALSDFDTQSFDGTWTLSVVDDAANDNGTLLQWCLLPTLVPPPPCTITDVVVGTQSACDPATLTYSQDLIISFIDEPATGSIDVNGQLFAIGTSPQTVTLTGLPADAMDVDVVISFTDLPFCNSTMLALYTAPPDCTPACSLPFTDTGGTNGTYSSGENETWTLCPDNAGEILTVSFSSFEVESDGEGACWDALFIYNGPNTTAPQIGPAAGYCYESATDGTTYPGGALDTPISSTHPTGCLTFNFISDGTVTTAGWEATVSCGAPSLVCGSNEVALNPASVTDIGPTCMQGPWTYYGDGTNTYFAIEKYPAGGNQSSFTAEVDVMVDAAIGSAEDAPNYNATYTMKRYWDVNINQGDLDGVVNVKFFYDMAEKTEVDDAAAAFVAANPGSLVRGFEWFKTNAGTFDPSTGLSAGGVNDALMLAESATGTESGVTFVQHDGITSFSGGTGTNGATENLLPVELISFEGAVERNGNLLSWETASEINTAYFELQGAQDGINFWPVKILKAKGTATTISNYAYMDRTTMNTSAYYRLRIVDEDGSHAFSDILHLKRSFESGMLLYPNPVRKELTLNFDIQEETVVQMTIYDAFGRRVFDQPDQILIPFSVISLNVADLVDGVYFLKVKGNEIDVLHKFVKLE